jgi:peptide chain release factor 2
MYKRFFDKRGYKVTILDESIAEFGYKSIEMKVEGLFPFGYLCGEKGVHRLVRISPFNSQNKRQTSFCGVEVWPNLQKELLDNIEIPDNVSIY